MIIIRTTCKNEILIAEAYERRANGIQFETQKKFREN